MLQSQQQEFILVRLSFSFSEELEKHIDNFPFVTFSELSAAVNQSALNMSL
jgi:hypothetical protein